MRWRTSAAVKTGVLVTGSSSRHKLLSHGVIQSRRAICAPKWGFLHISILLSFQPLSLGCVETRDLTDNRQKTKQKKNTTKSALLWKPKWHVSLIVLLSGNGRKWWEWFSLGYRACLIQFPRMFHERGDLCHSPPNIQFNNKRIRVYLR